MDYMDYMDGMDLWQGSEQAGRVVHEVDVVHFVQGARLIPRKRPLAGLLLADNPRCGVPLPGCFLMPAGMQRITP
jgi:hypothetical protein